MEKRKFLKITLIYLLLITAVCGIFLMSSLHVKLSDEWYTVIIQVGVLGVVGFGLYTLFIGKKFKQSFKYCLFCKVGGNTLLVTLMLGVLLFLLNSVLSSIFNGFIYMLGYETVSSAALATTKYNSSWFITEIIFTATIPAIFEELIHRGMLFHASKKAVGSRKALFISALLFGLMHMNVQQFFYAAILGYLIGLVAYHTNSIYPCIIIHFINNFLSLSVNFIEANTNISLDLTNILASMGITDALGVITCTSIAFMALIWAIIKCYQLLTRSMERSKIKRYVSILEQKGIEEVDAEQLTLHLQEAQEDKVKEFNNNRSYNDMPEQYKVGYRISVLLGALVTFFTFIWGII